MAEYHVGLDVSLDETSICVVDQDGKLLKECKAATEPADTIDYDGRISKCGDSEVRTALYEAASSLLVRCKTLSELRSWGLSLVKRRGHKKALVAVARKLATLLHRMWVDGSDFRPAAA